MEDIPRQNLSTTDAFAAALAQESQKGLGDRVTLSPTELGVRQTATMDMPPDYENIMENLLPGQNVVGNGSTIYNPNRSDPRVERILGEARYKAKKPENSVETMQAKMIEMQNQVAILTAVISNKPVPEPIKTEEQQAEEKQGGITEAELNAMNYQSVVKLAKSLALPISRNISKVDCIKLILDKKNR